MKHYIRTGQADWQINGFVNNAYINRTDTDIPLVIYKWMRFNTGSVAFDTFEHMEPNEKLNALFYKLSNLEKKQETDQTVRSFKTRYV